MIILANTDNEKFSLIGYLASKLGTNPSQLVGSMPFEVSAITRSGKPMGAVLYTNRRDTTIEMSWAGEPGWLTKENIREIWSYAFNQLKCLTVLGVVDLRNEKSRNLAKRMGCKIVGIIPHAFGDGNDGEMFCMSRDDCKWIRN